MKVILAALCGALLIMLGSIPKDMTEKPESSLEERVSEMCSLTEGVGGAKVMITYSEEGDVYAVAVLCEGADSVAVRERITHLVCSLFGIGAHRVSILKISE
jgi:hypothetical protein